MGNLGEPAQAQRLVALDTLMTKRRSLTRTLFSLFLMLWLSSSAYAQSGSICVAPPARPNKGEKSLANPAGGNPIQVYSIQIDKITPVVASNEKAVRISNISRSRKHVVKIIGDGKVIASFRLDFSKYQTKDLCLFFNALYETWSLWDGKEGRAICRCK